MSIQWFPGHMAKARRQVVEKLKMIDLVIELLDARLPLSSRNPMIDEIIANKPRMVLLNKADLADSNKTKLWLQFFEKENQKVLAVDAQTGKGVQKIPDVCHQLVSDLQEKRLSKGMQPRSVRVLIVGIPNVGKSSLINRLAKKSSLKTGDRPGITKAQQWIRLGNRLELLDTPGILWPKFDDQIIGYKLAASGAIKDEILDFQDIALFAANFLKEEYPTYLKDRYKLEEIPEDKVELLEAIGRKRGCLMSGGRIDYDKASELLLRELRSGTLGPITFEVP